MRGWKCSSKDESLREIDGLVQRYSAASIWAFWRRPE